MTSIKDSREIINITDGEKKNIRDHFKIIKHQVGKPGSFGAVYYCTRKSDKRTSAVKIINKEKYINRKDANVWFKHFRQECDILKTTKHDNIVELYDVFEGPKYLMLVMELCLGGELFNRIHDNAMKGISYNEHTAAKVMFQVINAVDFMHDEGIIHGDLKPANILFTNCKDSKVKVIDFGFAEKVPRWLRSLNKVVGTVEYQAPEMVKGSYYKQADMWSIGVILFAMLCGFTPFQARDPVQVKKLILQGFKKFPTCSASRSVRNLVKNLLETSVGKRYTAKQALMHRWFHKASAKNKIPQAVINQLKKTYAMDKFKVFVLAVFRNDKDLSRTGKLRKYFDVLDKDGDNKISYQEFEAGLRQFSNEKIDSSEMAQMFKDLDLDGDGTLDPDEFTSSIGFSQLISAYERLQVIFEQLDKNKNGFLDDEDIPLLEEEIKKDPLIRRMNINPREIIKQADLDNDGQVSFDEFLFALHPDLVEPEKRVKLEASQEDLFNPSKRGVDSVRRRGTPRKSKGKKPQISITQSKRGVESMGGRETFRKCSNLHEKSKEKKLQVTINQPKRGSNSMRGRGRASQRKSWRRHTKSKGVKRQHTLDETLNLVWNSSK